MRLALSSLRGKLVLPAVGAGLATVVATALTLALSRPVAQRLAEAREQEFPALLFCQYAESKLIEVNAHLRVVGESLQRIDAGGQLQAVYASVLTRVEAEGAAVLGEREGRKFREDLESYWREARAAAARRLERDAFRALAAGPGDVPELQAQRDAALRAQEIDDQYRSLQLQLASRERRAQAAMDQVLGEAASRQTQSIVLVAAILLGAAVGSAALAWWLTGFVSRPVRTLSQVALRIADGDLSTDVRVESRDEVGLLAGAFQRMVARLRHLVATLQSAAAELQTAAGQLSAHTGGQRQLLERQAKGVTSTTTATRELEQMSAVAADRAASVIEVAHRAGNLSEAGRSTAERSAGELHHIQTSVEGIVSQSGQLLDQVRQVGDIVEAVRDLATQSHVLSLNASIEAARAGEAGRSFAVVAREMRGLAEQSGAGASRIAQIVDHILTAVEATRDITERGSKGMAGSLRELRASGDGMREIGESVRVTSEAALQIAAAVQQQSTGVGQIAAAMRDLDAGMELTIESIQGLEGSARTVTETARRISEVAAEFQLAAS